MRSMKVFTGFLLVGMAIVARAAFEVTPAIQDDLDRHIERAKGFAANPALVKAVLAQNAKGPISGMDNARWKAVRRSDELIKSFQTNEAGRFLAQNVAQSNEIYSEAFLSAAQGEKVAFFEKTTSYIHRGAPKFDVPFTTGKVWQGKPEFDESSQTHQIQVSVPILSDGKAVGVLVVGVNLSKLAKAVQR